MRNPGHAGPAPSRRPAGQRVAERAPPAGAQGRGVHGRAHQRRVMAGQVEQGVGDGHGQPRRAGPGADDRVAGPDAALADHPHVEARPVVADQQRRQVRPAQPQADPVAGDARLGDLELGLADPVPVADAHLVVGQAVDGQVLAEAAVAEVVPPEMLLPVPVGVDLVDQHGPLLATVPGEVALAVAVDVEPADHGRAVDRVLPHPGMDGPALPGDVLGQAHVDRQQRRRHRGRSGAFSPVSGGPVMATSLHPARRPSHPVIRGRRRTGRPVPPGPAPGCC